MGKSKSLGYQIHSALNVINLQEPEKRTELFNKLNDTDFQYVGKREFKKLGQTKEFIFSKRTAENTTEKAKTFCTFLKEKYKTCKRYNTRYGNSILTDKRRMLCKNHKCI